MSYDTQFVSRETSLPNNAFNSGNLEKILGVNNSVTESIQKELNNAAKSINQIEIKKNS